MRGKKIHWFWRSLNGDGTVHSQSAAEFKSSVEAFEDAKKNGFDKDLHEWYMAQPGSEPCARIRRSG